MSASVTVLPVIPKSCACDICNAQNVEIAHGYVSGVETFYCAEGCAPVEYTNHETDDHGFPLCRCAPCREKSKLVNDRDFARMFRGIFSAGHDERVEQEDRDQDYAEQGGMK